MIHSKYWRYSVFRGLSLFEMVDFKRDLYTYRFLISVSVKMLMADSEKPQNKYRAILYWA